MEKNIKADESYWLDYLFKPEDGEVRLPDLNDDTLAQLGEFFFEDE